MRILCFAQLLRYSGRENGSKKGFYAIHNFRPRLKKIGFLDIITSSLKLSCLEFR